MPTYPPAHIRVVAQGTLQQYAGGGSEIFEFGFADDSGKTPQQVATIAAPLFLSSWANGGCQCSEYATLTGCRAEAVAADGTVSNSYYVPITPTQGLADGANWTLLSLCVTLETTTPDGHGRHVRGRFYPPAYPAGYGSTIAMADAVAYAQNWAGLIAGMKGQGLVPSVASQTAGGQIAHVTGVSAATVLDTQRRRKNHVTVARSPIEPVS